MRNYPLQNAFPLLASLITLLVAVAVPIQFSPVNAATSEPKIASSASAKINGAKAPGSLTVKIKPKAAKRAGARWKVDGGAWRKGGQTEAGLSDGEHTVTYKDIDGWNSPKAKDVTISANQDKTITGKYREQSDNLKTIILPGDVPLELVWIPAGSFMMGGYLNEQGSGSAENPQHQVTFANGFWLGKYEVTQAQWVAVMGSNPSAFAFTGNTSQPVESVSWDAVQTFITAVNALGQGTVHLPSEAQWEYACRAGTTTRYYWGDDLSNAQIGNYAWYNSNGNTITHAVGQKLPNAFQLYDMSGNVWEWCEDWYHSDYTGAPADGSAWTSPTGSQRIMRGGSWDDNGDWRSARRYPGSPSSGNANTGLRLAM